MSREPVTGGPCGGAATRPMVPGDAAAVLAIYQRGLDTGLASFELDAPGWADFDTSRLDTPRLVADNTGTGQVLGWATVSAVSARPVYSGVVENSIYIDPDAQGRGVGSTLLRALVAATEAAGIWTIQAGIFPENVASVAMHRAAGFRIVGIRRRIGRHRDRWRDVLWMERRSEITGIG